MKQLCLLLLCCVLAACGALPTPALWGATRFEVNRDGRDYVLFQKANQVEVIRLGWAKRGEHQAIRTTMIALIAEVTGCQPVAATLKVDSGEMRGRVKCPP